MKPFLPSNLIARAFAFLFALIPMLGLGQSPQNYNAGASGSFIVPCGVTSITVQMWGAGGAGGGGAVDGGYGGNGGGGGAYINVTIPVTGGQSFAYSVGSGGSGGTGVGPDGGNTTFGAATAFGGIGGGISTSTPSIGSIGTGGNFNLGGYSGSGSVGVSGNAGTLTNGGNGGASGSGAAGGNGGAQGANGTNATVNYGGGGGGGGERNGSAESGGNGNGGHITITYTVVTPTSASAGLDQTLATCITSTTLNGNSPSSGGTGLWTVSPAGPTFSPNASTPGATVSGLEPGINYTFTWTLSYPGCPNSTDQVVINTTQGIGCWNYCDVAYSNIADEEISLVTFGTLSNNPGSNTYSNYTTCNEYIVGNTYQLCVSMTMSNAWNNNVHAFFDWNNDGVFETDVDLGNQTGSGTLCTNITVPAGAVLGSSVMRIIINEGATEPTACTSGTFGDAADFCVTAISCNTTAPNAGLDQLLGSCVTSTSVTGNNITIGTGSWSLVSGSGTITNPTSATTTITNLGSGVNVFAWVATPIYAGCPVLSDNISITTTNLPSTANAGPDLGGCLTTQTMAATVPTSGTGTWTQITACGTANATTPTSATTTITGLCPGSNIWEWTVVNAACPLLFSSDQVEITIANSVTTSTAGPDQTGICWNAGALGIATLAGNTPVVGTGSWTINSNTTGGSLSSTTDPTADITGINLTGSITLTWTISSPGCSSSTDQVTITTQNCNGDEPCTALGLAVNSGSCAFSTFSTTPAMNISTGMPEPACAAINGPDIWFAVTVPPSGQVQLSANTTGTAFDEMISVYDGTCANLEFNGCVDGAGSDVYPLTYAGVPGSTIWVRVNEGGTGDATTGSFQICAYEATTANVSEVLPGVTTNITCGQTLNFYDTGGEGGTTTTNTSQPPPSGNYTNNTGTTWTICPSDPSQYVQISFNEFTLETGFDKMIITSGADDVIAQWTGNDGQGDVVTSQNPGECLTIYFQSDYIFTAEGWEAVVSCTSTPTASQISNECVVQNCTGGCGVWVCADGTYNTEAGAGSGIDEINEVTGGCWGGAGEVATSWFYFTTFSSGTLEFFFDPSNNGHNLNFALYGPSMDGTPPCPTITGDAPIRCSFTDQGGANTGMSSTNSDAYDGPFGNSFTSALAVGAGETYALVVDVYQNGAPPTSTTIDFTGALTLDCTVLPIELISFEGVNQGRKNMLNWIVGSQMNNDYFTIERSLNGKVWEIVGQVDGAGTTQSNMFYHLADENPYFPVTYYRLKQTDFDGKSKYSDIISISNNKEQGNDFIGLLSPNPTADYANFTYIGSDTKTPLNVQIVNELGEVINDLTFLDINKGMPYMIGTNDLAKGTYQIIFTQGDERQVQKLVIIR